MKFSCEKALLVSAVATTSRAVAAKSSIPAMEGILIEADTRLRLTGYDLEKGIQATVPAEIQEPGSLVLSARLFGEIIRKMPDDVVVFTAQNYMVNIKCGLSEFNILGTDPEEFPELPTVDQQNSLTLEQNVLRSMISQTLFAVSDNESRPIHTGSLFEVEKNGLTVVSVDGYRLALRREAVDKIDGAESFSFVVPGSALSEVEKICSGEGPVTISQGARHILFQAGETLLVCRRLEGEFLAYRNAIPRNNPIQVECDARTLLASIHSGGVRRPHPPGLHRPRLSDHQREAEEPPAVRVWGRHGVHYHQDGHRRRLRPVPHHRGRPESGDWLQQQVSDGRTKGGSGGQAEAGVLLLRRTS